LSLSVDIYAGHVPIGLAVVLVSFLTSFVKHIVANFIGRHAAHEVSEQTEFFSSFAFLSVNLKAFLVGENILLARHFIKLLAFAFILEVEILNNASKACENQEEEDQGDPLDPFLPEVEVRSHDLLLVDEGSENELLIFSLGLVLVDGELLLALDGDVWLLDIGERLVLGELF